VEGSFVVSRDISERAAVPDPQKALEDAVLKAGNAHSFALSVGLSPQYVADVRLGRRAPGPRLLAALGLQRVLSYASVDGARS
jgi:hypothetical protein